MHWIYAHLIGDFILQNDWMQRKSESSVVCLVHVFTYMIPFCYCGLNIYEFSLIAIQHFVQDRLGLAEYWIRIWKQSGSESWPEGRLWVDQVFHILFMASVVYFF